MARGPVLEAITSLKSSPQSLPFTGRFLSLPLNVVLSGSAAALSVNPDNLESSKFAATPRTNFLVSRSRILLLNIVVLT